MSKWFLSRGISACVIVVALLSVIPMPVAASHGWGKYHWKRTSSAIKYIPFRRYVSSIWVTRYNTAIADWRKSAMTKIRPKTTFIGPANKSCPMATGQGSVCDGLYGSTGWLGLATIYIAPGNHISRGMARQNNTYFKTKAYNTVAWRQFVICQEIGHIFGLAHVNEIFNNPNTGSCMDYTNDPDGGPGGASNTDKNNMHPNAHDYALINSRHLHIGFVEPERAWRPTDMPVAMDAYRAPITLPQFGSLVWSANGGRTQRYEVEFGGGWKVANWVIWANARDGR